MAYARFLSRLGRNRGPESLRNLAAKFQDVPRDLLQKSINVSNGYPNATTFPIKTINFTLGDGTTISLDEARTEIAMQYGLTPGLREMRQLVRDFIRHYHHPPLLGKPGGTEVVVSVGATDAMGKVFDMILDPGDTILCEETTFSIAASLIQTMELKPVGIEMDSHGIRPESLKKQMARWGPNARDKTNKPKMLYVVPHCQNPTGATLTLDRRKAIYELAQEHDFLIFEDDAYCFLAEELIPSFLSMDVDGRVIRADTMSKMFGGGLRLGFVSGPEPIIDKYNYHMQVSTAGCSSLSQLMVLDIMKKWGMSGFNLHAKKTANFYFDRRDVMHRIATKYVKDYLDWDMPLGGLFLWMKCKHLDDTRELVDTLISKHRVLISPGHTFCPLPDQKSPYIRAAFSHLNDQHMEDVFKALAIELKKAT